MIWSNYHENGASKSKWNHTWPFCSSADCSRYEKRNIIIRNPLEQSIPSSSYQTGLKHMQSQLAGWRGNGLTTKGKIIRNVIIARSSFNTTYLKSFLWHKLALSEKNQHQANMKMMRGWKNEAGKGVFIM